MTIAELNNADISLVEVKTTNNCKPTPHCKIHGAMNKITSDGIWRCISAISVRVVKVGNSIGKKENDNLCRAGCFQVK